MGPKTPANGLRARRLAASAAYTTTALAAAYTTAAAAYTTTAAAYTAAAMCGPQAVAFMRGAAAEAPPRPFFLYFAGTVPHTP